MKRVFIIAWLFLAAGLFLMPAINETWAEPVRLEVYINDWRTQWCPGGEGAHTTAGWKIVFRHPDSSIVVGELVTTDDAGSHNVIKLDEGEYVIELIQPNYDYTIVGSFSSLQGKYGQYLQVYDQNQCYCPITMWYKDKMNPDPYYDDHDFMLTLRACIVSELKGEPPKITFVDVPAEIKSGDAYTPFRIGYLDPDGDIKSLEYEIWDEDHDDMWVKIRSVDISKYTSGNSSGIYNKGYFNKFTLEYGQESLIYRARFILTDSKGNESEPVEYYLNIVQTRSRKIFGKATAFDSEDKPIAVAELDSPLPNAVKTSKTVTGSLLTTCKEEGPIKFCRTLPQEAETGASFPVKASIKNIGSTPLARVRIVETADTLRSMEFKDVAPNKTRSMAYSMKLPPPTVTITSPNGGESWISGSAKDITWTYSGDIGETVKLTLLRNGKEVLTIAESAPSGEQQKGVFPWSLPANLASGTTYKIRVTSNEFPDTKDASDKNFSIKIAPSLTIKSPNGGEHWQIGSTHKIKWTYTGDAGKAVWIELMKGSDVKRTLATSYPIGNNGGGSLDWELAGGLTPGSDYKIRINSSSDPPVEDTSNAPFTISSAALPNLTPFKPSGWADKITLSYIPGTHGDDRPIWSEDKVYLDWAVVNNGATPVKEKVTFTLYLDDDPVASWELPPPLPSNFYSYLEDYQLGFLSSGTHTVTIEADSTGLTLENNEGDNSYTKTFEVE